MSKELPYFRFTLQEWQNGTITDMPDSAQGVFINVCCYYWANNCNITEEMLLKRFKTKVKTIQKLIKSKVVKQQNAIISISFLDKQLTELNKTHSFFSKCGKEGQKAKKAKAPLKPPLIDGLSYKEKNKEKNNKKLTNFEAAFNSFKEMRKKIKAPLTENAEHLIIKKLAKMTNSDAERIGILNQSTMNSWKGVFELREDSTKNNRTPGINVNDLKKKYEQQ